MKITRITIGQDNPKGTGNIDIEATPEGARVTRITDGPGVGQLERLGLMRPTADDDARWALAEKATAVLCGLDHRGRTNATHSMVRDVLHEIERVAGY